MKEFWDQRYSEPHYVYGEEPNEYFKKFLDAFQGKPGRLLLPGEGEGRNAVYAARLGWEVTAFDQSAEGKKKALQLAAKYGVSIQYEVCDVLHFPFEEASFDLAGVFFFHLPRPLRDFTHPRLVSALRPGGMLVAELFTPRQLGKTSGGPQTTELLYEPEDLRREFQALEIELLEELTIELNEGPHHQGEASVVRLVGKKI